MERVYPKIISKLKWYQKAADQGDAQGQTLLGFLYLQGKGVQRDYQQALKWFQKSGEQGNRSSLFLRNMYKMV